MEVKMAKNQSIKGNFTYNNIEKKGKNFMYKNLERSNCYNSDFSSSNFDYVNFRGAHFKACVFSKCSFKWTQFVGTNFKDSDFTNTTFENAIFDSVNLDGADFKDAEFENTIFVSTDVIKAKNFSTKRPGVKVFKEIPELEISDELREAVLNVMRNKYVKAARVLDTKDGGINIISLMILLENFDEETLIKGLNLIETQLKCDFYTLSYIVKFLKNNM